MKSFMLFLVPPLVCAIPAFASVTITSPTSGSEVVSPFHLVAAASDCSSQPVTSMGYSIDTSSPTTVRGASISVNVSSIIGAHVVHIASYGRRGAVCDASVAIIVVPDPATQVPAGALVFSNVQKLSDWQGTEDTSISGSTASGTTKLVPSPSLSGSARQFVMQFTNYGAERYSAVFSGNTPAASITSLTNFLYDGWIYLARPSSAIANVETDVNQVLANDETVIYGFQCDGYSGTWDYTENAAAPPANSSAWSHSSNDCNPRSWSTNTWHHLQITFMLNPDSTVTYQSVYFDGVEQELNAVAPSAFTLDWATVLLTNFQIDGYGAGGSATAYLDKLTISGW